MMIVLSVSVVGAHLYFFRTIVGPFVLGFALGFAFQGLLGLTSRLRLPRTLTALLITGTFFSLFSVFMAHVVTFLGGLLETLWQDIPTHLTHIHNTLSQNGTGHPETPLLGQIFQSLVNHTAIGPHHITQALHAGSLWTKNMLTQAIKDIQTIEVGFFYAITTPLITFQVMRDWPNIRDFFQKALPQMLHEDMRHLFQVMGRLMHKALTGQMLYCGLCMLCFPACFWTLEIPHALTLGLLSGFLAFIPYLGILTSMLLTGLVMLSAGLGDGAFMASASVYAALFLFKKGSSIFLITRQDVHPVWIFFTTFVAHLLFGPAGTLMTLPLAATSYAIFAWVLKENTHRPAIKLRLKPKTGGKTSGGPSGGKQARKA